MIQKSSSIKVVRILSPQFDFGLPDLSIILSIHCPTTLYLTSIHPSVRSPIHNNNNDNRDIIYRIHQSILPFVHPSFRSFIHPSVRSSIHPFVHPSFRSFIHPSVFHPSFRSFIHPSAHSS